MFVLLGQLSFAYYILASLHADKRPTLELDTNVATKTVDAKTTRTKVDNKRQIADEYWDQHTPQTHIPATTKKKE